MYLVGAKRVLGTGVMLTAAFRSVCFELDWRQYPGNQSDRLVSRLSQLNKETYNHYIVGDSVLDPKI